MIRKTRTIKLSVYMGIPVIILFIYSNVLEMQGWREETDLLRITTNNLDRLELGYALPGHCGDVSPDDRFIGIYEQGVYEIAAGERVLELRLRNHGFSPQGRLFAAEYDSVYDTTTWEPMVSNPRAGIPAFHPQDAFVAVTGTALYSVPSFERIIRTSNTAIFDPTGEYLAVLRRGVYDLTGTQSFPIPQGIPVFSPLGHYLAVWQDGVYDVPSGEPIFSFGGVVPEFSPDERYLYVSEEGVYEIPSREILLPIRGGSSARFSPDSRYIAVDGDGVYEITSGERLLQF